MNSSYPYVQPKVVEGLFYVPRVTRLNLDRVADDYPIHSGHFCPRFVGLFFRLSHQYRSLGNCVNNQSGIGVRIANTRKATDLAIICTKFNAIIHPEGKQRYRRWSAVAAESSELRVSRDIFAMQERLPAGVEYQKANRARC